jgi:DNA invertase Pin-like site-specific DNA recombinase
MAAYDGTGATAYRSRHLITGKCVLDMLGVLAEFETNLRKERQLDGIATAKAARVYKGRPASIDAAQVREMKSQGIAKALGIGRASVYRALETG